jgi:hypothetical protein
MLVQPIPIGHIVDTTAKLSAEHIQPLLDADYRGVARYLRLPGLSDVQDIDASELTALVNGGLGVLLVQHVRYPGWNPANYAGAVDAAAATVQATAAGYPMGAHIFVDLEGISGTAADTAKFANDWADAVVAAGYLAGCYVGYNVPLSPAELYELHRVNSYWSDPGPRKVATRGFAIKQAAQIMISGLKFDPNVVARDNEDETPRWAISEAVA